MITPTFFINGRRYDGPWDESSLSDAMLGTLGHRVRSAALDFHSWGPSAGVLLLLATLLATTGSNRRLTVCCGMPGRARVTSCCRCSRWPMPGSP
jgi:NhaA family Na+:H+ antiporter